MKHIILLLYTLSFLTGVSAMLIGWMIYIRQKKEFVKLAMLADSFFSCILFIDIINFYSGINQLVGAELFSFILLLGLITCVLGMLYFSTLSIYGLVDVRIPKYWKRLYALIVTVLVALFFVLNILSANGIIDLVKYPSSFLIHNIASAIGTFYSIYLVLKYRSKIIADARKYFYIAIGIESLLIPLAVTINTMEYWVDFGMPMPFSPISYFPINILLILYVSKRFLKHPEGSAEKSTKESELKEYLSRFEISNREYEIVRCLVEGLGNQEIAERLFISPNTVKNHVYNIYKKMGIKNRYELLSQLSGYIDKSKNTENTGISKE